MKIFQNNIYFYTDVTKRTVCKLNTIIDSLNSSLTADLHALNISVNKMTINLFINSGGGSIHAGLSAMDHIRASRIPITTIIDGECASAATFLSLGGHRRLIKKHAFILIHQLSIDGFWGNYEEFKDEFKNCDMLMKVLSNLYTSNTKITKKKITQILSRELYMNSKQAISIGLVDDYFA